MSADLRREASLHQISPANCASRAPDRTVLDTSSIEERIRNSISAVKSAGSVVADLREKLKSYEETIYELRAARAVLEREKADAELYRTKVEEVLKAQRARIDEHDAALLNLKDELKVKNTENASLSGQFSSLMEAIDQTFGSPRRPAFPPLKLAS